MSLVAPGARDLVLSDSVIIRAYKEYLLYTF